MVDFVKFAATNRTGLEQAQKELLPKRASGRRGDDRQRAFVRLAAEDPQGFCQEVRSWGVKDGQPPPVPECPMTENEFVDPPWLTEERIASTWKMLSASAAARPETWTHIHVAMIEQEKIQSFYLAADDNGSSGLQQIRQVLDRNDPEQVDKCVRKIMRRLGGVIDRGNRTAFVDCPIARAWWRYRYAQEAHGKFGESIEKVSEGLRPGNSWINLIEAMVSRLTVTGDRAIRPAVVQYLTAGIENARPATDVLNWVGRRSTTLALGALDPGEVLHLIEKWSQECR